MSITRDAGAWNKGSLADNYATGPNPDTFCAVAGFESMHHFLPQHACVRPPPDVLSLMMPAVLERNDGTILCIEKALALYRSREVRGRWYVVNVLRLHFSIRADTIGTANKRQSVQKEDAAKADWKFVQLLEVMEHCAVVLAQVRTSSHSRALYDVHSSMQAGIALAVILNMMI